MRRSNPALYLLLALFAPSGCASVKGDPVKLSIDVRPNSDGTCISSIDGKTFDATSEPAIRSALKSHPIKDVEVRILADINVPYRCIGTLIYTLQKMGYAKVSFISEPPGDD